ncbi:MAG: GntR family transcriptional regulator [Tissierellia bacterium]|mgnify:CR=1 FL=1|nr:GntR family transcriptional regulator [Tissierellia bacterium]
MISFESFIKESDLPLYQQIELFIKRGAIRGSIKDEDELPSRRMLSAILSVNPNTVQKAYKNLEDEGLIHTVLGSKSVMSLDEEKIGKLREELVKGEAVKTVRAMKEMGISKNQGVKLLEKVWEEVDL